MLKYILVVCAVFTGAVGAMAQDNDISIVALVLTNSGANQSTEAMVISLEALDADIIRADQANASEMRSVLKRFTDAASENDVALVYIDGTVLQSERRDYVAPSDLHLTRKSDLLTQTIPISAFVRATGRARSGGAVFVHSALNGVTLIEGVTLTQEAPTLRAGNNPVLIASDGQNALLTNLFGDDARQARVNLTRVLTTLSARAGLSLSHLPATDVMLRVPAVVLPVVAPPVVTDVDQPQTVIVAEPVTVDEPADTVVVAPVTPIEIPQIEPLETTEQAVAVVPPAAEPPQMTLELLTALQNGLSRLEKRNVQRGLKLAGHYGGAIDGLFGGGTARAIRLYQEALGAEVTGVLSVQQLEALRQ